MNKLKAAMIGCGRISSVYKQAFNSIKDNVNVVYSVDIDERKARDFAKEFPYCKPLTNYKDLLDKEIDVIHIATPHYLHAPLAIDCLNHGYNVLTEKPMAITLKDADAIINTADKTGTKLGVIFQTRYVKGCMELKKIIDEGKLGEIIGARSFLSWIRPDSFYAQSNWKGTWAKAGGGVLIDQAIHSIDRVQWLVGSDVDWIEGSMHTRTHKIADAEDVAEALVSFKNGCLYQLYASNSYVYNAPIEIEIVGEKGKAGLRQDLAWIHIDDGEKYEINDDNDELQVGPSYWGNSHVIQIKDFYHSVRYNKPVFIDGFQGKKALELVLGIYKSAREGKRLWIPFSE